MHCWVCAAVRDTFCLPKFTSLVLCMRVGMQCLSTAWTHMRLHVSTAGRTITYGETLGTCGRGATVALRS